MVRLLFLTLLLGGVVLRASAQGLTIVQTQPAAYTMTASVGAPIQLTFSAPVALPPPDAVQVYGALTGRRTGTFSGGGSAVLTFTPTIPFLAGEQVTVNVTTQVQRPTGTPLASPYRFTFATATTPAPATFHPTADWPVAGYAQRFQLADVNGDGAVDVVVGNNNLRAVQVLYNNGAGTGFSLQTLPTGAGLAGDVAVADLDADGDPDLLVAGANPITIPPTDTLTVFRNDGNRQFVAISRHTESDRTLNGLATADFDGDGDLDVATTAGAHPAGARLVLLTNDGTGHLTVADTVGVDSYDPQYAVQAADLDQDGAPDLLVGAANGGSARLLFNQGRGQFSADTVLFGPGSYNCSGIGLLDADADGDADVLLGGSVPVTGAVIRHTNRGPRRWDGPGQYVISPSSGLGRVGALAVGDFDGNGHPDFIVPTAASVLTMAYATANQWLPFTLPLTPNYEFAFDGDLADMDGDGDLDLVVLEWGSVWGCAVTVLLNNTLPTGLPQPVAGGFTLAPNPAHHAVRLTGAPAGSVYLLDAVGRTVRTYHLEPQSSPLELPLSGLPPGLYTVRAGAVARRLVVE